MGNVGTAANGMTLIGSGLGLSPTFAAVGTLSGLTAHGVVVAEGNGAFTATNVGTAGQVLTSAGPGLDPSFQTPAVTTDLHAARYIVSAGGAANGANYTTIAAAITAASVAGGNQTVFIQPGTYTENLTLVANINLTAFTCDGSFNEISNTNNSNVTIIGKLTATFSGGCAISGIQLQTNSDFILVASAGAANIEFINCTFNLSNHTGFSVTSAGHKIQAYNCIGNLGTTGIAYLALSANSTVTFYGGNYFNSGSSTTASTVSAGQFNLNNIAGFQNPVTSSGTGSVNAHYTQISTGNTTCLTIGGSGQNTYEYCTLTSGSASAMSIGATANVYFCDISSSNTNVITGAGTINYQGLIFSSSSSTINTTTKVPSAWPVLQGGTGLTSIAANTLLYASSSNTMAALAVPAFTARYTTATSNVTGDGTIFTLIPDTADVNIGTCYNTSTGVFTAPFTGTYSLCMGAYLQNLGAGHTQTNYIISASGKSYYINQMNDVPDLVGGAFQLGGTVLAHMAANDTATATVTVNNSTKTVGTFGANNGNYYTYFSGSLVALG